MKRVIALAAIAAGTALLVATQYAIVLGGWGW
jgi:hypothetical protein